MRRMSEASRKRWSRLGMQVGVFLIMACVLAAVLLYPAWLSLDRTRARLDDLNARLDEQKALLPLRASFLAQRRDMPEVDVIVPEIEPVSRMQVFMLRERLSELVRMAGMEPLEINLNALDIAPGAKELSVDFVAAGASVDIRPLFVAVASSPHVIRIGRFEVRAVRGGVEVFMNIRLAVGGTGEARGGQSG